MTQAIETGPPSGVSIVIKALNEEARIALAIESALAAASEVAPLPLEVVVADSLSTDRTVEVASRYPVRVVRLRSTAHRGCGAGLQLGYAASTGQWVYLMDGDMVLQPGFIQAALRRLQADPGLGGVAGAVVDERVSNAFDRIRVNNRTGQGEGERPWLEGGGLFRREAITRAGGYAADRNLKGYEEAELGLRVRAAGFRLLRLAQVAVSHRGHDAGTWELMRRHWRSGRAFSAGMLLRLAVGRPWWRSVLWLHRQPFAAVAWWCALPLLALSGIGVAAVMALWGGVTVLALIVFAWRKRDLQHALASVAGWHYAAAAIVAGWFQPRLDPTLPIDAELVHEPSIHMPPRQ